MLTNSEAEVRSNEENSRKESSKFICFRCGICCTGYQIYMTTDESHALAERLGISQMEFAYNYTDPAWPFPGSVILRRNAGKCLFLDQAKDSIIGLCRIHSFKPLCCQQWQAGLNRKECRQGLSRFWNLKVGEDGELTGSLEDKTCFQAFIDFISEEDEG